MYQKKGKEKINESRIEIRDIDGIEFRPEWKDDIERVDPKSTHENGPMHIIKYEDSTTAYAHILINGRKTLDEHNL